MLHAARQRRLSVTLRHARISAHGVGPAPCATHGVHRHRPAWRGALGSGCSTLYNASNCLIKESKSLKSSVKTSKDYKKRESARVISERPSGRKISYHDYDSEEDFEHAKMVRERSTKSRASGLVGDKVWELKREKYPEPYEANPETLFLVGQEKLMIVKINLILVTIVPTILLPVL